MAASVVAIAEAGGAEVVAEVAVATPMWREERGGDAAGAATDSAVTAEPASPACESSALSSLLAVSAALVARPVGGCVALCLPLRSFSRAMSWRCYGVRTACATRIRLFQQILR